VSKGPGRRPPGRWSRLVARALGRTQVFPGSQEYWEERYARGGNSGRGSFGELATHKAKFLNEFVRDQGIETVIEFGCGDGSQLSLARYPNYIGLDVARTAIELCSMRFKGDRTKNFFLYDPQAYVDQHGVFRAQLALSLDVIYHLTEDPVFELYMRHLFAAAEQFVIVYSSNAEMPDAESHIRHREFTAWVAATLPEWRLAHRMPNPYPVSDDRRSGSFADFFVFQRA
jgi:cyclopropane fatty-acyl-phospholipid synthase-like methyltransferase